MVEVRDEQDDPQLFTEFEKNAQESHRVWSAGDGDCDAIAGMKQTVRANVLEDRGLHSSMVHLEQRVILKVTDTSLNSLDNNGPSTTDFR